MEQPQTDTLTTLVQQRRKLPDTRMSMTHSFQIGDPKADGLEVAIIVGLYEDRMPGEIFVEITSQASTLASLIDAWAIMVSMALQYGTPLESIVKKFAYSNFEPQGWTANPKIRNAKSVLDYVARWLGHTFIPNYAGQST